MEKRIKRFLNLIIDTAYENESDYIRNRYKDFWISIVNKELKSSNGKYYPEDKRIEVYNPHRGYKGMAKTCIHELAHHIDYCKHGSTGHKDPFYKEYKRLIYTSMDLGVLSANDFSNDLYSADSKKVDKIVREYVPHKINRNRNHPSVIRIRKGYDIRHQLKERGYRWNSIEEVWEKEIWDTAEEVAFLEQIGHDNYTIDTPDMYIHPVIRIIAQGDTYTHKEELKQEGFYYVAKTNTWICKTDNESPAEFMQHLQKKIPELDFAILSKGK